MNNYIKKLNSLFNKALHNLPLLLGTGAVALLGLSFLIIYFVRVVYEPKWIGQLQGTLILAGVLFILTALGFGVNKYCRRNKALLMTLLIFISGTLFCFITPPNQVPDEPSHFMRSYAMAMGDFHFDEQQQWPNDVHLLMEAFPVAYRNGYPAVNGNSILDRFDIYFDSIEAGKTGTPTGIIIFQIIPYLPGALGIFIARLLGGDALICYYLCRLANLAFYCVCGYYSLKWAKRFNLILFSVMALPLTLFIAASCNTDSVFFGLMFLILGAALSDSFDKPKAIAFALSFGVLCTGKASYIVFILLLALCLGNDKYKLKMKKWVYALCVLATFFVIYQGMGMLVSLLSNYGEIPRTMEGSDPSAQLMFVISNPLRYFVVFLDTLRNNSFFLSTGGLFGWIDVDIKFISFLTPLMLVWATVKNAPLFEKKDLTATVTLFATALLTYGVVLTGMYLSWTPVTLPQVIGLQMRYVLPALFGFMFPIAYRTKAMVKEPDENYEKSDGVYIYTAYAVAIVAALLLFAAYYFTTKSIVYVS